MSCNLRTRIVKHPLLILALFSVGVLMISACRTDQVDVPDLTGPSGHRLFITMSAAPDHLSIKEPGKPPQCSNITAQLKDQLGNGVAGENIKFRITNREGSEINIGTLNHLSATTDAGGFARVQYCAPNSAEQPIPTLIFILSILTNPAYTFEVTGIHQLDLESALPGGEECVFGSPNAPVPTFTQTPAAATVNQEVCFDGTGSTDNGQIVAASWSFGDGSIATGLTACHTFTSEGVFVVTFTVQDEDRNCASITRTITIGVGGAPTCDFTISPTAPELDEPVTFNSTASTDDDGNIVSRTWNFGDGGTASGAIVTHTFTEPGSFVVQLTLRDDAGNITTCTQTVNIGVGEVPTCAFSVVNIDDTAPFQVTFNSSASTDADGTIVQHIWNFGDGTPAFNGGADSTETHSYTTAGIFTVTLTIVDNDGNSVQCQQEITVGPVPTCDFTQAPNPSCVGEGVNFTFTGTCPSGSCTFAWTFEGGSPATSANENPTVTFTTAGSAAVSLTVTDELTGLTCTQESTQTVNDVPTITSFSPLAGAEGQTVVITGTGFVTAANGGTVDFNGTPATIVSVNSTGTSLTTAVPVGATDGPIHVSNACGTGTSALSFDVCGALTITAPAPTLEGNGGGSTPFNFTVSTSNSCSVNQTATFTTTNAGTCGDVTEDADFDAGSPPIGTVTIPATFTNQTLTIQIDADDTLEADECFTVTLSNPTNSTLGSPSAAEATILNDPGDL